MASDPPPSYESIVSKLNGLVGDNPTPQRVMDAAATLPQDEVDILAANHEKHPPLTDAQHKTFSVGVAQTASSPEAAPHIQTAAALATAANDSIDTMFTTLAGELSKLDSKYPNSSGGPFAPKLADFHTHFRRTVQDSKDLAVKIAIYGTRFDEIIIPLVQDPKYTIDMRKAKLAEFIEQAHEFSDDATTMKEKFSKFKDDFQIFVGTFGTWARNQEKDDNEKIKKAQDKLADLNVELAKLNAALLALGITSAASLPITGIAAALSGPFAPFVLIGGLIFAGASLASTVGLWFAAQSKQQEIKWKQKEIADLQNEVSTIKNTRAGVEKLGKTDTVEFAKNIDAIGNVWEATHNDALRVQRWLQDGARDADMPEYMKISTDKAVKVYAAMADYLNKYADGIRDGN